MLAACRKQLDLGERWKPGGDLVRLWRDRLDITGAWTE